MHEDIRAHAHPLKKAYLKLGTDRQVHKDRRSYRQTSIPPDRRTEPIHEPTVRLAYRQTSIQTDKHAYRRAYRQTYKQTSIQINKLQTETDKHADRKAYIKIYRHAYRQTSF